MKYIIFTLLLLVSSFTHAVQCQALSDYGMSQRQIEVMYQSFEYGRERNLSYSLAAIAFKESSAGNPRFMRNPNDPSAGFHGVKLTHLIEYFNMEDTPNNRAMVEDMLVNSHGASAFFAMEILEWWVERHNGDFFRAWRSYNGGYYWWTSRPNHRAVSQRTQEYANDIRDMIRIIRQCNWD